MAVPKHRTSRSRVRSRRAHGQAVPVDLVLITVDSTVHRVPRHLVRTFQRGLRALP